jgi:predicted transcriptional regulator YdeE
VIGLETRTNNAKEGGPNGEIPKTWQTFYMEGAIDRIPDKVDDSIIAVYTDYASDANGDYTYILGAKVKPGTKPPSGMISKQIPGGKFEEFTSEQGALPVVIPKVWRQIYEYFSAQGAPARAYRADYELYTATLDPNNASAKVYVGVK